MKTAFLFPGQGAQVVGMGADIARAFPTAAEIFENANDLLGYDLRSICFEGPAEQLNSTTISQPAIFTTSAAILEMLKSAPPTNDFIPEATAGLSLGEYTALYAAGLISFADALALVQKRGQAMQAAADATEGTMVSVLGLDDEMVKQLCDQASEGQLLKPVNFNCPGQIVLSGAKPACARAEALAREFGAISATILEVAGAFHTEMMSPAAEALEHALSNCRIAPPADIKVIANINAEYYCTPDEIARGLVKQLTCPILWQKSMERLLAEGFDKFYEIGPGRVLTGLMKRINRKTKVVNLSSLDSIEQLLTQNLA